MIYFMGFVKKLFRKENFLPILLVVISALLAGRTLIFEKGYFNMHDDLQMMRQLEMEKCFFDGQIPCRWVPDMGYGYGFPLFNFYPPLPYLIGEVFRIMQFSFVDTAKLTFALSLVLSGITMYFLTKNFFGRWGGVVSSIFYIWAPYHSVDIYVRGAMNEAWAFIWFPLILMTSYRLIKEKKKTFKWVIGLALSWVGLLLSHNLMVMVFAPIFAVWCLMFWLKKHDLKKVLQLAISGITAAGLAAFFTIPSILEQKYVHVDTLTQGYYEYIAHFATIGQLLFSRFWGYGPSIWGPNDGMPFAVGHIHWILSLVILLIAGYVVIKRKKNKIEPEILYVVFFSLIVGWFAAFMAHQNSTFIWQKIRFLSFVQFPWRFLAPATLGFSLVSGAIVILLPKKIGFILGGLLVLGVIIFNWNNFLPLGGKMGALTDTEKFQGAAWDLQRTAGIFDYLPITAKQNPKDPPKILAEVVDGKGEISGISQGTNWGRFKVNLSQDSTIRVNLFKFPIWKITIDGKEVQADVPDSEVYGRMYLGVSRGEHSVDLKLENTPLRTFCNYLSLTSWIVLLLYPFWKKRLFKGGN
jgi:hypothetical protein